ncbi:C-C motif chemokine [Pimephales promelas]|nr:C-C motif chemokine [Pimephales promelas]
MKSHMLGFSAVLLLLLLVSSSVKDPVIRSSCLTTTNTRIPMKNLVGYNIQNKPLFRVIAVRFLTIKGITICSDPSSQWAIKAMKYLDAKKKHQSAIKYSSSICDSGS